MTIDRRMMMAAGIAAAATLASPLALGQGFPAKPIELVIPYPPGASTDLIGRIMQGGLSAALGQPVVIDNKGGAGGNVGASYVAKSAPDGYRLLLATNAITTINPHVTKGGNFDAAKELTAVGQIANTPIAIAVRADAPYSSIAELVAFAKSNPGKLSYGTPGNGSPHHIIGELLKQQAGINMVHVPYRGVGPAMTDLLGGSIQVVLSTLAGLVPQVAAGKVKVLATAEAKRVEGAANIPVVAETYPGFVASSWFGIYAPTGTPPDVIRRLNAAINTVVASEDAKSKMTAAFLVPEGGSVESFAKLTQADYARWGQLVREKNIRAD